MLVVRHDGDDGVVYEQAKGEDPRETWKRRSGNIKSFQKSADDDLGWFAIPGKGNVLLTGLVTELRIDSPPWFLFCIKHHFNFTLVLCQTSLTRTLP